MGRKALICITILLAAVIGAPARGAVTLDLAVPRLGFFGFNASSPASLSRRIRTADSDEPVKTFEVPVSGRQITSFSLDVDQQTYRDTVAGLTPLPSSTAIIRAPQDLDAGNWAMAIGVYDDFGLVSFFQYRLAGASATVMDPALATQAVNAGLWTGINDYFEFPAAHAGVSQSGPTQSGPSSFYSFVIPEPQAWLLTMPAALFWVRYAKLKGRAL